MDNHEFYDSLVTWLYSIPNWMVATIFIGGLAGIGLLANHLVPRWISSQRLEDIENNSAISLYAQTISVAYGILIGLVAVACWDNFIAVKNLISEETASIGIFYRLSYGISDPSAVALRAAVIEYLEAIVMQDWEALAVGDACDAGFGYVNDLREKLMNLRLSSSKEEAIYQKLLDTYEDLTKSRQTRLNSAIDLGVPAVFWFVILLGGLCTTVMNSFIKFPSETTRAMMLIIYSSVLGLMYFLIAVIDNPFRGEVHVSSAPYVVLKTELIRDR